MRPTQVVCFIMSVNELLQDLGALFLLYTSVGDAEGVLNTGKLAEAGAVMTQLMTHSFYGF